MKYIFLLLTINTIIFAHPHIFIDVSAKYDDKEQRLYMQWLIDDASSELMKFDYDTNRNNHFEPQEVKKLLDKEGYGMFFYRADFFLHPKHSIEDLDATIVDGRVFITFETDSRSSNFIEVWDEEILFSFHIKDISGLAYREVDEGYFGLRLEKRLMQIAG